MNKIGIVARREYLRRVNKKSFIILTLLVPVLFAALVFVPLWLSTIKSSDVRQVTVIDHTGKYAKLFKDTDNFKFVSVGADSPIGKVKESSPDAFAYLEIRDDLLDNPGAVSLYSEKQIPMDLSNNVNNVLSRYLEDEKRASYNIPDLENIIKNSQVNIDVQTIKWAKDGTATESSSMIGSVIGMVFTFIIYMFILMYGAMVMQGVMEEKTNRIVEVMVSSVRPFDLMMGKILGIGLVGITQVLIWCVLTFVLVSVVSVAMGMGSGIPDAAALSAVGSADLENDPSSVMDFFSKFRSFNFFEIIVYFILFFIGGYISYSSLYAAVGAAIDNPEDSQQFMTPLMVLLIFALYAGIYGAQNPDGPLAFWCSLIPFTSPIVMMIRIPYDVPFWQVFLSLALLYGTAVFLVWVCAKIYRVGILMYGKKPSFKEIAKWIRYK